MQSTAEPTTYPKNSALQIYTLGAFCVKKGEEELSEKTRLSIKLWELFKYLLTHRGKRVFPEEALETLWPELEYADPKASFRYQVFRIRKALKQALLNDTSIELASLGGSFSLQKKEGCWLDAEEFESVSRQAKEIARDHPKEGINLYYQALSLYQGDYLPGVASHWVYPVRNYYRHLFLRNVLELAGLLEQTQRCPEVIDLCRSSFLIEPLEESLHLKYLEALIAESKIAQARTHYAYITSLLYREMGVKPSREMQRLYGAIKSNSTMPNYASLKELLHREEQDSGALLCEPEVFRFLLNRERNRAEREEASLHVCLLSLTSSDFSSPVPDKLKIAMEELKRILMSRLRKCDVFTPWNEAEYVLLLPGLSYQQAEIVLQRLRQRFRDIYPDREIVLRCNAHSLFLSEKE